MYLLEGAYCTSQGQVLVQNGLLFPLTGRSIRPAQSKKYGKSMDLSLYNKPGFHLGFSSRVGGGCDNCQAKGARTIVILQAFSISKEYYSAH